MYSVRPNWLMRKTYSSAVWRVPTKGKKIFLTFDDGPTPEITPWVLSVLKKQNAKATFFCVGANVEKHPEVFQQIIAEGHSIGNHTFNHLNGWKTKTKEYLENVARAKKTMDDVLGMMDDGKNPDHQPSTINHQPFFRPPYGRMKPSQYSMLTTHYSVVMWDVLSGDFDEALSKEKCLKNVLSNTREGSVIVFHDSMKAKEKLFYVLPRAIEHFSQNGYAFEKLSAVV